MNPDKYKSIGNGFAVTVREDGVRGLAKGWAPTFIGYSMQGLCKFGFYEVFKILYSDLLGEVSGTFWHLTGNACQSRVGMSHASGLRKKDGMSLKESFERLLTMKLLWVVTLFWRNLNCLFHVCKWSVGYVWLAWNYSYFLPLCDQQENTYLWRTSLYLAASASAEFFADIALAPMEAAKVRIQTQPGYANTLRECAPKMYAEEGLWA